MTNCLNFGSPEDPAVMWQFAEAVRGLADGCQELGIPVTGGNVSFYNQTGTAAIQPTPVVGVLGVLADVRRRLPGGFGQPGLPVVLLGRTRPELGGSLWAQVAHGHLAAGRRPWTWPPSSAWAPCWRPERSRNCWPRPMTCPTAGWRWRSPSAA